MSAPVLLTGGSGRLGTELLRLLPASLGEVVAPRRAELDVTDAAGTSAYFERQAPRMVIHAAAFTDVAGAEADRPACWATNVTGTRNVVAAARATGSRLLFVSTDYVFSGERGGYSEDDPPGPPANYYALTKLVAEEAVRSLPGSLVVRTSFRPRAWQYEVAFDDLFTSQDYVDVIAPLVAEAAARYSHGEVPFDTLHVATERKSVYDLAVRRAPNVRRASRLGAAVALPADVSLDTSRWQALRAAWGEATDTRVAAGRAASSGAA